MNALEALKLSKETGAVVSNPSYKYRFANDTLEWGNSDDEDWRPERYKHSVQFHQSEIINDDGSPVEWEIVP